jgi:hypothetical protein
VKESARCQRMTERRRIKTAARGPARSARAGRAGNGFSARTAA